MVSLKLKEEEEHLETEDEESYDSSDHSELETLNEPEVKQRASRKKKKEPKEEPKEEPMETGDDESSDSSDHSELDTLNEEDFNLDPPEEEEDDTDVKHASQYYCMNNCFLIAHETFLGCKAGIHKM